MLAPCYSIYYDGPACIRASSKYLVKLVQIKTAGLECLLEIEKFLKGPNTSSSRPLALRSICFWIEIPQATSYIARRGLYVQQHWCIIWPAIYLADLWNVRRPRDNTQHRQPSKKERPLTTDVLIFFLLDFPIWPLNLWSFTHQPPLLPE
jgi:hypothetical protein